MWFSDSEPDQRVATNGHGVACSLTTTLEYEIYDEEGIALNDRDALERHKDIIRREDRQRSFDICARESRNVNDEETFLVIQEKVYRLEDPCLEYLGRLRQGLTERGVGLLDRA